MSFWLVRRPSGRRTDPRVGSVGSDGGRAGGSGGGPQGGLGTGGRAATGGPRDGRAESRAGCRPRGYLRGFFRYVMTCPLTCHQVMRYHHGMTCRRAMTCHLMTCRYVMSCHIGVSKNVSLNIDALAVPEALVNSFRILLIFSTRLNPPQRHTLSETNHIRIEPGDPRNRIPAPGTQPERQREC